MDGTSQRASDEAAHAGWMELFFDLVFVAALTLLNAFVLASPSNTFLIESAVASGALLTIWLVVTLIYSWFPGDDTWRRINVLVIMTGLMLAALCVDPVVGLGYDLGQYAYGAALIALSLMLVRVLRQPHVPRTSVYAAIAVCWLAAALCVVAANIQQSPEVEFGSILVTTVMLLIPVNIMLTQLPRGGVHLRARHLTERLGQLALITLGEGFTVLAVNMQRPDVDPDLKFFLLTCVLAFLLWRMFFDGVLRGNGVFVRWRMAFLGQYLLLLGIVWFFDVLTELSAYANDAATRWDAVQLALAATITFLGFASLNHARGTERDARPWMHVGIAAVNLAVVTVLVISGAGIRVTAFASIVLVAVDSLTAVRLAVRHERRQDAG